VKDTYYFYKIKELGCLGFVTRFRKGSVREAMAAVSLTRQVETHHMLLAAQVALLVSAMHSKKVNASVAPDVVSLTEMMVPTLVEVAEATLVDIKPEVVLVTTTPERVAHVTLSREESVREAMAVVMPTVARSLPMVVVSLVTTLLPVAVEVGGPEALQYAMLS